MITELQKVDLENQCLCFVTLLIVLVYSFVLGRELPVCSF